MAMVRHESVVITAAMLSSIAAIDEFKGAWRALGRLAPERLGQLRKVATIESVGSSTRIEGSRLSDQEVEALLSRAREGGFATRDEQEVAGYAGVMDLVFESFASIAIDERHLMQLHRVLLAHSTKDERHRGRYKSLPNPIEAFDASGRSLGVVFETATPFETPRRMEALFAWHREREATGTLHPLIVIGMFVVEFLAVHPFQDGNGRLSRVLTTLLLLRAGYEYVPYSSLESVVEASKDQYYLALRRTQGTLGSENPEWSAWLGFFLRSLREQVRRLEAKVERERLMRAAMGEGARAILEMANAHGSVSVGEVVRGLGVPRGTAKKRLADLVREGYLSVSGVGRGTRYAVV
jgi:Fic family protein